MARSFGLHFNEYVSDFTGLKEAKNAGCDFVIGRMCMDYVGQDETKFNWNYPKLVEAAWAANINIVGGSYNVNFVRAHDLAPDTPNWGYPGQLNANNPILKDIFNMVRNYGMQFLILEHGQWSWVNSTKIEDMMTGMIPDVWYALIAVAVSNYLKDHIVETNHRIKDRILHMCSKYIIDNAYPALKQEGFLGDELAMSDYNITAQKDITFDDIVNLKRPDDPMDVAQGGNWKFVRFANASVRIKDENGNYLFGGKRVGLVEYNGDSNALSSWTGTTIIDPNPVDPPIVDPPIPGDAVDISAYRDIVQSIANRVKIIHDNL